MTHHEAARRFSSGLLRGMAEAFSLHERMTLACGHPEADACVFTPTAVALLLDFEAAGRLDFRITNLAPPGEIVLCPPVKRWHR